MTTAPGPVVYGYSVDRTGNHHLSLPGVRCVLLGSTLLFALGRYPVWAARDDGATR